MSELSMFAQYNKIADQLIEKVSKDDLAECARLLALNVAHYQSKYGELCLMRRHSEAVQQFLSLFLRQCVWPCYVQLYQR